MPVLDVCVAVARVFCSIKVSSRSVGRKASEIPRSTWATAIEVGPATIPRTFSALSTADWTWAAADSVSCSRRKAPIPAPRMPSAVPPRIFPASSPSFSEKKLPIPPSAPSPLKRSAIPEPETALESRSPKPSTASWNESFSASALC